MLALLQSFSAHDGKVSVAYLPDVIPVSTADHLRYSEPVSDERLTA